MMCDSMYRRPVQGRAGPADRLDLEVGVIDRVGKRTRIVLDVAAEPVSVDAVFVDDGDKWREGHCKLPTEKAVNENGKLLP